MTHPTFTEIEAALKSVNRFFRVVAAQAIPLGCKNRGVEKMLSYSYAAASGAVKEEKLKEKYATIAADTKNKSEGLCGDG